MSKYIKKKKEENCHQLNRRLEASLLLQLFSLKKKNFGLISHALGPLFPDQELNLCPLHQTGES